MAKTITEVLSKKTIIYTDGASSGNPGPGGWGAVLRRGDKVVELGGSEDESTNNRMEMSAAIGALEATESGEEINLYTDSQYLINGITKWVFGWIDNNWQTKDKKDVLNKDLWQKLFLLTQERKINWVAVKGHAGVALNNRVDEIAVAFSQSTKDKSNLPKLFCGLAADYSYEVKEPTQLEMSSEKANSKKGKKAYSYLSMVDSKIEKHQNWEECKARVNGVAGAKFAKSLDATEEIEIIKKWQK